MDYFYSINAVNSVTLWSIKPIPSFPVNPIILKLYLMKNTFTYLLFFVLVLTFSATFAQTAQEHFSEGNWKKAEAEFQKYLKKNPNDSSAWFNLAISQMNLGKYAQAQKNLGEATNRNFNASLVAFNQAKIHAMQSDRENTLMVLEKAAENGLFTYSSLNQDQAFDFLRNNDRFKQVMHRVELNAYPCLSDENMRHFDFWLGSWDVFLGETWVGSNYITMAKGGCAIHEYYVTERNYAGQSINYYDPIDKKWHQHWVGSSGDVYNYLETKREEGFLQFESPFLNPLTGQKSISRLTFTLNPDGTVTQLFENSTDGGGTWTEGFKGIYRKKLEEF